MARRPPTWVVATVAVAVVTAAAGVVVLLRSDGRIDTGAVARPAAPSVSVAPSTTIPASSRDASPASAPFAVDRIDLTMVDAALDDRAVSVAVWYSLHSGPVPLVVFAHGYATGPDTYESFLEGLASAGYVVVAPRSYATRAYVGSGDGVAPPETAEASALRFADEDTPPGEDVPSEQPGDDSASGISFDFEDQRLDVVAVMDVLLGSDAPAELKGRVAPGKVGVIGHSDGGVTAAAVAFNSIVGDGRVGAAVIASGDYGYFGGSWFGEGSPALLALHGDADGVNPVSSSIRLFDADPESPRYLVVVHGVGHLGLLLDDPPETEVIGLVNDFFGGFLRGDPSARARVDTDADGTLLDLVAAG